MLLEKLIRKHIKKNGPLSFHDFMEMALYYPGLGYYTSPRTKIGKEGDFYTSSCLTPAFGATLARQLEEMSDTLDSPEFTVVEYGAGSGLLCAQILESIETNKSLRKPVKYCIIEKSPVMRQLAEKRLGKRVTCYNSIDELNGFTGCVLSNELLDNFAVHRVVMQNGLKEVFVDYHNGFVEILKPAGHELLDYFSELRVTLPEGHQTEVNLQAIEWIKQVAQGLKKGYVITIDYGHPSGELYCSERSNGTLTCYNRHRINYQPYYSIGDQDITAHVNFSALCLWGYKNGLDFCGYRSQGDFLHALEFRSYLGTQSGNDTSLLKREKQDFISHLMLNELGAKLKVLIQQKGLGKFALTGLVN